MNRRLADYRGLQNWETERGYLRDTCGLAQDRFQQVLEYFNIDRTIKNSKFFSIVRFMGLIVCYMY